MQNSTLTSCVFKVLRRRWWRSKKRTRSSLWIGFPTRWWPRSVKCLLAVSFDWRWVRWKKLVRSERLLMYMWHDQVFAWLQPSSATPQRSKSYSSELRHNMQCVTLMSCLGRVMRTWLVIPLASRLCFGDVHSCTGIPTRAWVSDTRLFFLLYHYVKIDSCYDGCLRRNGIHRGNRIFRSYLFDVYDGRVPDV